MVIIVTIINTFVTTCSVLTYHIFQVPQLKNKKNQGPSPKLRSHVAQPQIFSERHDYASSHQKLLTSGGVPTPRRKSLFEAHKIHMVSTTTSINMYAESRWEYFTFKKKIFFLRWHFVTLAKDSRHAWNLFWC